MKATPARGDRRAQAKHVRARQVSWAGLAANVVLTAFKFAAGFIGRSQAMISDAAESFSDIIASLIVVISLRISGRPEDEGHPYGHGKAESLATAIVGFIIGVAGFGILYGTMRTVIRGTAVVPGVIALWAALVTIAVKEIMYRVFLYESAKLHSTVLKANAVDYRKDALTSVATLVGIGGARLGLPFLDPLAGAVVSVFIIKIGFDVVAVAAQELMDAMPVAPTAHEIVRLAAACPGVEHVYGVRARRVGQYIFVDLKIEVDPQLSVEKGHEIAKRVKKELTDSADEVRDVLVHVNPHYT